MRTSKREQRRHDEQMAMVLDAKPKYNHAEKMEYVKACIERDFSGLPYEVSEPFCHEGTGSTEYKIRIFTPDHKIELGETGCRFDMLIGPYSKVRQDSILGGGSGS